MCSTLKWVCRRLQSHLGVCAHIQAVGAARPPAQQVMAECKPLLARAAVCAMGMRPIRALQLEVLHMLHRRG